MKRHDSLNDGQAESRARSVLRIAQTVKAIEDSRQTVRADSLAGIDYAHADRLGLRGHLNAHLAARLRMTQRILQQIADRPFDQSNISVHSDAAGVEERAKLNAVTFGLKPKAQCHILQQLGNRDWLDSRHDRSGFESGELEQRVDESSQLVRLPECDAEVRLQVRGRQTLGFDEQRLNIATK